MPHSDQANLLGVKAKAFSDAHGVQLSYEIEQSSVLLLNWLQYLNASQRTGVADELLDGVASSILEVAACLSLGLVRPSIFLLRVQIDLSLSWLYFKDHPVEWAHVNRTGEGFKLKKELLEFLSVHRPGFKTRLGLLHQIITRADADTYRFLSAHVHGQSTPVVVSTTSMDSVVHSMPQCLECVVLVSAAAEYINDLWAAYFVDCWHALPQEVQTRLTVRFVSAKQKREFFVVSTGVE